MKRIGTLVKVEDSTMCVVPLIGPDFRKWNEEYGQQPHVIGCRIVAKAAKATVVQVVHRLARGRAYTVPEEVADELIALGYAKELTDEG